MKYSWVEKGESNLSDTPSNLARWQVPDLSLPEGVTIPSPGDVKQAPIVDTVLAEKEKQAEAKGYQVGRWEGMTAGKAEVDEQVDKLRNLLDAMVTPFAHMDDNVAKSLAYLAAAMAKEIIRREVAMDPALMLSMASRAVETLSSQENRVEVFLNPTDLQVCENSWQDAPPEPRWTLVADASLARGDCRVRSGPSTVDASIQQQVETMLAEMLDNLDDPQVELF